MSVLDRLFGRELPSHAATPTEPPAAEAPAIVAANLAPVRRRYFDAERGIWIEDERGETPDMTGAVRGRLLIFGCGWLDPDNPPD
jgi:hypothetical protein